MSVIELPPYFSGIDFQLPIVPRLIDVFEIVAATGTISSPAWNRKQRFARTNIKPELSTRWFWGLPPGRTYTVLRAVVGTRSTLLELGED